MIAAYEAEGRPVEYGSPRQYALGQLHKHLPEMQAVSGLQYAAGILTRSLRIFTAAWP